MTDTFTCAHCGGTFPKAWTDEEAQAEADNQWADELGAGMDMAVICDDCYQRFMGWAKNEGLA